jgi:hypothetical protein
VARLRELAADVAAGRGGAVWVEGEPGIGKSSVLAAGLAGAAARVFWGTCEELGQRLPLRVLTAGLGIEESSADPGLAAVAGLLNRAAAGGGWRVDAVGTAVRGCGVGGAGGVARPLVLVVDDAQGRMRRACWWWRSWPGWWAVAGAGGGGGVAAPRRAEVVAARRAVTSQRSAVGRCCWVRCRRRRSSCRLVGRRLAGPALGVAAAAGNPLYVRERVDALVREQRPSGADGRAGRSHRRAGVAAEAI